MGQSFYARWTRGHGQISNRGLIGTHGVLRYDTDIDLHQTTDTQTVNTLFRRAPRCVESVGN
jgi:hypothetical protein